MSRAKLSRKGARQSAAILTGDSGFVCFAETNSSQKVIVMQSLEELIPLKRPTARRPLLGTTMLLVEDSRFVCEAVRLLSTRSGARIRRADSIANARRHLAIYHPSVAIIDVGLPDGSGLDLIETLTHGTPKIDVVLGTSGDSSFEDQVMAAGANGFLTKPIASLASFQSAILDHLPRDRQPPARAITDETVDPEKIAFHDDLMHIRDILTGHNDNETLDYATQFLQGVAASVGDSDLEQAVATLAKHRNGNQKSKAALDNLTVLLEARLKETEVI